MVWPGRGGFFLLSENFVVESLESRVHIDDFEMLLLSQVANKLSIANHNLCCRHHREARIAGGGYIVEQRRFE